ncbi:MAG: hypothetical protein V4613_00530 [Bacteroidota bacterium]
MKSFKWILFVFIATQFLSCKKDKSKSEIELDYPIFFPEVMEIDTLNVDSLIVRETISFTIDLESDLTNKNLIKSAHLTSLRIQTADYAFYDSANHCNFNDIKEIYLSIKNVDVGTELVAQKITIPNTRVKVLYLDVLGTELRDYLRKDNFQMVVKYRKKRAMPHQLPFYITGKFKILADPL